MADHYVWLIWSSVFLVPWALLLGWSREDWRVMLGASVLTAPFGLTEPLFFSRYWNPPSLFDLAQRTCFDLESVIFCFALGGVGIVLYNVLTREGWDPLPASEHAGRRHRFHRLAVWAPAVAFSVLYGLPWNPIYPAMAAMALGWLATALCRPDLMTKTAVGGGLFAAYYLLFMLGLSWTAPGYIERAWNLAALSGIVIGGILLEEILFGFAFGVYWAGAYEQLTWQRVVDPLSNAGRRRSQ